MIPRLVHSHIQDQLSRSPAVIVLGPRDVGKTTLSRAFSEVYFNIEIPQDGVRLDMEWIRRMRGPELMILDEIQAQPEMFLRLRAAIDERPARTGRFLLLGSVASPLMKSLAGRLARCELSPLMARECPKAQWDHLWRCGGYPEGGLLEERTFFTWQNRYLEQMVQRDLPDWGFPATPRLTQRMFRMLAAVHGQVWNASQIGKSMGISYHTVNAYMDFLERAFLIRRLPACSLDMRKRLIKSPKFYWRDSGILHTLRDLGQEGDLFSQPWVGVSWEGWIIEQILGSLDASGHPYQAYHFSTSDRYTLDLLLDYKKQRWAIDISLTSLPEEERLSRLQTTSDIVDADRVILISRTATPVEYDRTVSINLADTLDLMLS